MATNIYGINDNYTPGKAHMIPFLIKLMHDSKLKQFPIIELLGAGLSTIRTWFLFVDELAEAALYLMQNYIDRGLINVGFDKSNRGLAYLIKDVVGFERDFFFNNSNPEGALQKVLNMEKLNSLGMEKQNKFDWRYTSVLQGFYITFIIC